MALVAAAGSCNEDIDRFQMVFDPCDPLVLVLPDDLDEMRRDAIADGIDMWNDVATVGTGFDGPEDARILQVHFIDTNWYMGRFDDQEGAIWLATRVDDPHALAVVTAHELGHAFGMYHVEPSERVSVMNPGNSELPPTAGDVEVLEHMWGPCITGGPQE